MICAECGREHAITGQVRVDGAALPPAAVEVMIEIFCKHGILGVPGEPEDTLVEPDVEHGGEA